MVVEKNIVRDLQELDLEEKEAQVYLAALELGPSPVQKIALRAHIPRATTYLILDSLREKGLITTFDKGKKSFFAAESPQQLSMLLAEKVRTMQRQKEILNDLLPLLDERGQFEKSNRPTVRYYEGPQALNAFIRDSFAPHQGELLGIIHLDRATETLQQANFAIEKVAKRRNQLKIPTRMIYTSAHGPRPGYSNPQRQAKYVMEKDFPFETDISVRGDFVFFMPYGAPLRGVAIQDKAIANTMNLVFELMWRCLSE